MKNERASKIKILSVIAEYPGLNEKELYEYLQTAEDSPLELKQEIGGTNRMLINMEEKRCISFQGTKVFGPRKYGTGSIVNINLTEKGYQYLEQLQADSKKNDSVLIFL